MVAIALANQKGGVGKTTVTLGFAEAACCLGLKVLVIDCDPQANATAGFGLNINDVQNTLAQIIEKEIVLTPQNKSDYIYTSPWANEIAKVERNAGTIDVITSTPSLASVETHLSSDPIGSCDRVERAIENIKNEYDVILFDCPPSIGHLTINALFAADEVVIISAPSAWSSDGVELFAKNVDRIAQRRGKPKISGIVINNVGRTRDGKYWESEISSKNSIQNVTIASRAAIAESSAMSLPLRSLGSRPGAPDAARNFVDAFCKLIGIANIGHEAIIDDQSNKSGTIPATALSS